MIARGSWVLRPSGSAHDLILSLSVGNDCKDVLGPQTLGFYARPHYISLWGMIARGSWVLSPSGSAHDLIILSLFWGMTARGSWVLDPRVLRTTLSLPGGVLPGALPGALSCALSGDLSGDFPGDPWRFLRPGLHRKRRFPSRFCGKHFVLDPF